MYNCKFVQMHIYICTHVHSLLPGSCTPRRRQAVLDIDEAANLPKRAMERAGQKLEELVQMEEAYISTDDPAFLAELQAAVKKLVNKLS